MLTKNKVPIATMFKTASGVNKGVISRLVRYKSTSAPVTAADGALADSNPSALSFSSITQSIRGDDSDGKISNVINPSISTSDRGIDGVRKGVFKANLVPVKYILSCLFAKNNTHFTYSAVVEDVNYLKNNPDISYNKAFLHYLKLPQKVKFATSTGCLGFRKAARGEYEAAFQTSTKVFQMIQERRLLDKDIEIVFNDFGKGRAAFIAALSGKEGAAIRKNVIRISDKTPLKFGGVRAPRTRRL